MKIITIARKPLSEKNVASNVLKHGCGALNIDGCRIETEVEAISFTTRTAPIYSGCTMNAGNVGGVKSSISSCNPTGRWPSNLLIDGSDEVVGLFPESKPSGAAISGKPATAKKTGMFFSDQNFGNGTLHNDTGSAARFFKQFKVDK